MPVTQQFQNSTGTQSGQQAGTSTTQAQSPGLTAQQNLSAVPDLASLTTLINGINQNAQQSANANRLPGGPELLAQQSANIGTGLTGKLDPSVMAMLQQQGAELGIGHGMGPGAPSSNAAYLKALGQTVQGTQAAAGQQLNAALSVNPSAPIFNPSQFLLTPSQAGTTTTNQGTNSGRTSNSSSGSTIYPEQPAAPSFGPGGGGGGLKPGVNQGLADTSWLDSLFGSGASSTPSAPMSQQQWWNAIGYGNQGVGSLTGPVNPNWFDTSTLGLPVENLTGPVNPNPESSASLSGLSPGVSGSEFDSLFNGV